MNTPGWMVAISVANAILAFVAFLVNTWAASTVTSKRLKCAWLVTAAVAALISMSFMWLALNPEGALDFGNLFRPLSLFVWPIVWTWVPIEVVRYHRRSGRKLENIVAQDVNKRRRESPHA